MRSWDTHTTADEVIEELGENVKGKTYVLTGPSEKSLAAETALTLAKAHPAHIILIGRSEAKIQPVMDQIRKIDSNIKTSWVYVDFLDNSTVREGAKKTKQLTDKIHGLLNCAGIMGVKDYTLSKDGFESQFACDYLSHFLLTTLLLPEIKAGQGVISNVSSRGFEIMPVNLDDPNFNNGKTYNGWYGYGQAKCAQVLFAFELAKRLEKDNVVAFALTPGTTTDTSLQTSTPISQDFFKEGVEIATKANNGKPPNVSLITVQQAASTLVWSLIDPKLRRYTGSFLECCNITTDVKDFAMDPNNAAKLWEMSEKWVAQ